MRITVTPDNEIEIWDGNKKLGYMENNSALWAISNNRAEYVGEVHNRDEILPSLRIWFRKKLMGS